MTRTTDTLDRRRAVFRENERRLAAGGPSRTARTASSAIDEATSSRTEGIDPW